jgi:lysozyme
VSHPARSRGLSAAGVRLPGVGAVAIGVVFVLSALVPQNGSAARTTLTEPSGRMAAAVGGLGCYPTPTPTPAPSPTDPPEPTPDAPVASPVGVRTTALAAVVRSDVRTDARATTGGTAAAAADGPRGIDISKYDGAVDMSLVMAAGVRFVITKATQGATHVDPWYSAHMAAARSVGIAVGSYHFFDYRQGGVRQADNFVDTMAANGALMDTLPPVVDVECSASMGQADRVNARSRLRALVERVYARTGRVVMIYTSAHMWGQVTGNDTTFGGSPLWVAYWSKTDAPILPLGWTRWTFWQYGPKSIPGIARKFDGNVAKGTNTTVEHLRSRPMVVAGDAALSRGGSLPIRIRGLDGTHLRTSTDDQPWSDWIPRASADHVVLHGPDGVRRVRVQPRNDHGTLGPVVSDTITIDSTAPVVAAPRITLRSGSVALGSLPIPARLTWSGTDPASGVISADFRAECGGTSLIPPDAASEASGPRYKIIGSSDHWLASGTRCVSSATVVDAAGNQTTTGDIAVTVRGIQETPSSVLTYSHGWRSVRTALAFGGTLRTIKSLNQWVRLRFTGTEIAVVGTKGHDRGRIRITIDGVRVAIVELRSPTSASRRIVFHKRLRPGRHTIEVRTLGSARQPRRPARVDIDGFLVIGP